MRTKRRKPTALKVSQGLYDPRYAPVNEPRPVDRSPPDAPPWLDEVALKAWHAIVPELVAMGVIARIDGTLVAAFCEVFSQWRAAESLCKAAAASDPANGGLLVTTKTGSVIQHPARGIANVLRRDMLRLASEIGLSPSGRAHMEARVDENEDPVDREYFANG